MAAFLPQELYANIYTNLWSNHDILSCSLVCRAWLPSTRQTTLFVDVTLTSNNADTFADLVINILSSFPCCIRKLTLAVDIVWFLRLRPFLQSLPNLRTLRIRNLRWTGTKSDIMLQSIAVFCQTTQELVLGPNVTFECLYEATRLISQFSVLKELVMEDVRWSTSLPNGTPLKHPSTYSLPQACRSASFSNCKLADITSWILAHDSFPRIESLRLGSMKVEEVTRLRGLCYAGGHIIKHLSLSFDTNEDPEGVLDFTPTGLSDLQLTATALATAAASWDSLSLQNLASGFQDGHHPYASLTTLRLDNFIGLARGQSCGTFYAMKVIETVVLYARLMQGCGLLEQVTFQVLLCRAGDLDRHMIHWQILEETLLDLEVSLRNHRDRLFEGTTRNDIKYIFEIGGGAGLDATAALIRGKLPRCRSIVFVEEKSPPHKYTS